jgi:integrase
MKKIGASQGVAKAKRAPKQRKAEEDSAGRNVFARSFHSLRHSFVTALADANVAIELRRRLGGDASEEQSLHYTHPDSRLFARPSRSYRERETHEQGRRAALKRRTIKPVLCGRHFRAVALFEVRP